MLLQERTTKIMDNAQLVKIKTSNQPLQKEQKRFNTLITQINNNRNRLLEWKEAIVKYQKLYTNEYLPLEKQYDICRADMVIIFDKYYNDKCFSKLDRQKMSSIICDVSEDMADEYEHLKSIYNKYSDGDYDENMEYMKEQASHMMKQMAMIAMGVEIDNDITDPEEVMKLIMDSAKNKQIEKEERKAKRKKSAKIIEKEALQNQEKQDISKSIREVYRQLASTLHPDRITDGFTQDEKTSLMQKVNVAYNNNDILTLLETQLQIEQIDQKHISDISIEKLNHFNKILKLQLQELEQEIEFVRTKFSHDFDVDYMYTVCPDYPIERLNKNISSIKTSIAEVTEDVDKMVDAKAIKLFLKTRVVKKING